MATDEKKMKYYFQTAIFPYMQIIGHGSLYTYPQNLYPLNFSNFFTNSTEKLGYHSNEIGKKMNISFHTVFFHQRMILYGK
jgi:hypothetical protein